MDQFLWVEVSHVPRFKNDKADTLAKLTLIFMDEQDIQITIEERQLLALALDCSDEINEMNVASVFEVKKEADWRKPLIKYIQYGILPNDPKKIVDVKWRAMRFIFNNDTLYRKAFDGVFLRCLSREKATYVLNEVHVEVYGARQAGPKLVDQIRRLGYYWPIMVQDTIKFAKACQVCQIHGDFIHQLP